MKSSPPDMVINGVVSAVISVPTSGDTPVTTGGRSSVVINPGSPQM